MVKGQPSVCLVSTSALMQTTSPVYVNKEAGLTTDLAVNVTILPKRSVLSPSHHIWVEMKEEGGQFDITYSS